MLPLSAAAASAERAEGGLPCSCLLLLPGPTDAPRTRTHTNPLLTPCWTTEERSPPLPYPIMSHLFARPSQHCKRPCCDPCLLCLSVLVACAARVFILHFSRATPLSSVLCRCAVVVVCLRLDVSCKTLTSRATHNTHTTHCCGLPAASGFTTHTQSCVPSPSTPRPDTPVLCCNTHTIALQAHMRCLGFYKHAGMMVLG